MREPNVFIVYPLYTHIESLADLKKLPHDLGDGVDSLWLALLLPQEQVEFLAHQTNIFNSTHM